MTDTPNSAASPAGSTTSPTAVPSSTHPRPSLLAATTSAFRPTSTASSSNGSEALSSVTTAVLAGGWSGGGLGAAPAATLPPTGAPSLGAASLLAPIPSQPAFFDAPSSSGVGGPLSERAAVGPASGSVPRPRPPRPTDPRRPHLAAASREASPAQAAPIGGAAVQASAPSSLASSSPAPSAPSSAFKAPASLLQPIIEPSSSATLSPAESAPPTPMVQQRQQSPSLPRPPASPQQAPVLEPAAPTSEQSAPAPEPQQQPAQPPKIRLKLSQPPPPPSPPRKAAAPRRSVSVLPVRDEIYNLPSDDDDDMIECEPDPEDVKPTIVPPPPQATNKSSKSSAVKAGTVKATVIVAKEERIDRRSKEEELEKERKRRKKEKRLEEERNEEARKEARRKEKAAEKERVSEKERLAREREGKKAALASWKKPSAPSSGQSSTSQKDARPSQSGSGQTSSSKAPAAPSQQSIFTKKPAVIVPTLKRPATEQPLFSRATPGPSIDLTGDDSSPAPVPQPVSLKRPAPPASPVEDQPVAKRPALEARPASSGKKASQLSSSIFAFLESGDVVEAPRDEELERPRDPRQEKAKDDAFIVLSDDDSADDAPIRPKIYGKKVTLRSSSPTELSTTVDEVDAPMDVDEAPARAEGSSVRGRDGSVAPIPPSNMRTVVPVEIKAENDMPTMDAKVVTQMYKGREVSFKKESDGFFNCSICRAYSKPHPVLFKIHVVRCAADFENYPSDSSDGSGSESDGGSYASETAAPKATASKGKGKGKARQPDNDSDSDDAGSGSGASDAAPRKRVRKDPGDDRAARKVKLEAKNATRKEKRQAKKQRRDLKDDEKEKKPKIRRENRKIPSLARPSGGPGGSKAVIKGKKARAAAGSDDDIEHIEVKPLGGTRRQQPFARTAAVTLDQEHLVVDSDDSQSEDDDDTIVVLVRGEVVHVRPIDGRYSCPACNCYKCKNPGWLKEHVLRCKRAIAQPGSGITAPDPILSGSFRARSPSAVPLPPQLARTRTIKNRNSPVPALPSFRKKSFALGYDGAGASARAGPSRLTDFPLSSRHDAYQEACAAAFMGHQPPQQQPAYQDDYADSGFDAGRYSPPPDQRFSPPPNTSAANLHPLAPNGALYGYGFRADTDRRRASPSPPPRSPPPPGFPYDEGPRTDHPSPGFLVHTLANLLYPIMTKPPPMALMQEIPLLLELLRRWQAIIISDARKGFENGVANAQEGQVLRRAWSTMMQASAVETRYATWQDNAFRLWHLQHQLTHRLDRPSDFRDLVAAYFSLENRPTVWASGRTEQKHISNLGTACRNLLRALQNVYKAYKGPADRSVNWLMSANISVATPVHLDLNHVSWEDISASMLEWADNILHCYQELLDVEGRSRETAEAKARVEREHRARLAQHGVFLS